MESLEAEGTIKQTGNCFLLSLSLALFLTDSQLMCISDERSLLQENKYFYYNDLDSDLSLTQ